MVFSMYFLYIVCKISLYDMKQTRTKTHKFIKILPLWVVYSFRHVQSFDAMNYTLKKNLA